MEHYRWWSEQEFKEASNPKKYLLPTILLMAVGLALYSAALATSYWKEGPCLEGNRTHMGLWEVCVDSQGCEVFIGQWDNLPGWLKAGMGLHTAGAAGTLITFLLMVLSLAVPDDVVEDSSTGLALSAVASAVVTIIGQVKLMPARANVYHVLDKVDKFSNVFCVDTSDPGSGYSMTLAWLASVSVLLAGFIIFLAGVFKGSRLDFSKRRGQDQGGGDSKKSGGGGNLAMKLMRPRSRPAAEESSRL